MSRRFLIMGALILALSCSASAQTPSPEAMTAARALVTTMKLDARYKAMLPVILLGIKPALVQDRPEIERDYDAMAATAADVYTPYSNAMLDSVAALYASTFQVEELRQIEAFYRTPAGQKLLEKAPGIAQQSDDLVQDISRKAADELKARLTEMLRQKGHKF
ncbi:DUF2059 domain-containing protein [Bradyrhizobium sp. STM 3557]|uniref:DUF2059 domain-containing protein n=1 Tax=Bradyrhizobium sp. STM 3557 TaxID=578920 RepID=UPI00388DA0DE